MSETNDPDISPTAAAIIKTIQANGYEVLISAAGGRVELLAPDRRIIKDGNIGDDTHVFRVRADDVESAAAELARQIGVELADG